MNLYGDVGRIQTCNLLSRNQMRYSIAPRRLFKTKPKNEFKICFWGVWSHLGSNQGPPDYESGALTN